MVICQLKKRDWALVAIIVCLLSVIWIISNALAGAMADAVLIVAGIGLIVIVILDLYRRRIIAKNEVSLQTNRIINNHARRLEDILSISTFIEPRVPFSLIRVTGFELETDFLRKMVELIVSKKPMLTLETGSGLSTVVAGYCLDKIGEGRLISLEHDRDHYERTKRELSIHRLEHCVELIHAPLVTNKVGSEMLQWYDVSKLNIDEPIDLFVIDGPPRRSGPLARYPALPLLYDKLGKDAVVIMDDGNRKDERMIVERWKNEYHDLEVNYLDFVYGAFMLTKQQEPDQNK